MLKKMKWKLLIVNCFSPVARYILSEHSKSGNIVIYNNNILYYIKYK